MLPGSPGDFGKLIAEDTEKWAKGDPGSEHQSRVRPDVP